MILQSHPFNNANTFQALWVWKVFCFNAWNLIVQKQDLCAVFLNFILHYKFTFMGIYPLNKVFLVPFNPLSGYKTLKNEG
jgi:prophage maintenance system killer protein